MMHKMKLNDLPFRLIEQGRKTMELRLYDEKRRAVLPGDIIEFTHIQEPNRHIYAKVLALHVFPTFNELYAAFDMNRYSPNEDTPALPDDMLSYYPLCAQKENCVVGIEITLAEML